jgi:galactokinase
MSPDTPELVSPFHRAFLGPPAGLARAPGRVNLIGEHTDYNGLPVLPMALEHGITIAFRPRRDRLVVLHNTDSRFPLIEFELGESIPPDPPGSWGNYPRAAAQGLWRERRLPRGLDGLVSSTLPIAAGLSSSSALVVATALALLEVNEAAMDPLALADLLARGERYVGLQGGGMDQAVSLGAREGHAVRIAFRPKLTLTPVPVPADWRIIVASSLVEAAKSGGARDAYNTRVRECREALRQFADRYLPGPAPADYAELLERMLADEALRLGSVSLAGTLRHRFAHVVSEAVRVEQAADALEAGDLPRFGRLLHASHASLRDDYEVSCAELDELVALAQEGGAEGARLTGAGFGGCVIAVTDEAGCAPVMEALWRAFFAPRAVPAGRRDQVLFVARPGGPAECREVGGPG